MRDGLLVLPLLQSNYIPQSCSINPQEMRSTSAALHSVTVLVTNKLLLCYLLLILCRHGQHHMEAAGGAAAVQRKAEGMRGTSAQLPFHCFY
jgi:hypothetical protein